MVLGSGNLAAEMMRVHAMLFEEAGGPNSFFEAAKSGGQVLFFATLGLVVFGAAFWLITKVTPFSIRKEIEEDQNVALGVVIGAVIIGLALIISTAIS